MKFSIHFSILFLFLFLLRPTTATGTTISIGTATTSPTIGVTYIPTSTNTPSPEKIANALQSHCITAVRLPLPDPTIIRSFTYSNTSLLLDVPNHLLPSFAANRSAALLWLYTHVVPFYPRAHISAISVGSNALTTSPADLTDHLLPAMRNLHLSLQSLGIPKITISTIFSFIDIIRSPFPPSAAEFQEPINTLIIKPLLDFLKETNSSFFINIHPYKVYRVNPQIPIGFALFQDHPYSFRDDSVTGVRYRNLFDVMVDAVIAAMAVSGHENIPVVVTETGWPSYTSGSEPEARHHYSEMYLQGLFSHLRSGLGTPLRKEGVAETYVYELFDNASEQQGSSGNGLRENWGIMYPNLTMKYNIAFSMGCKRIDGDAATLAIGVFFVVAIFLLL